MDTPLPSSPGQVERFLPRLLGDDDAVAGFGLFQGVADRRERSLLAGAGDEQRLRLGGFGLS